MGHIVLATAATRLLSSSYVVALRDAVHDVRETHRAMAVTAPKIGAELVQALRKPKNQFMGAMLALGLTQTVVTHGEFHLPRPARILPEIAAGASVEGEPVSNFLDDLIANPQRARVVANAAYANQLETMVAA